MLRFNLLNRQIYVCKVLHTVEFSLYYFSEHNFASQEMYQSRVWETLIIQGFL